MNIKLATSLTMDKETGWNDEYEHRIVRIPLAYREANNLKLGEFIKFREIEGSINTFQIAEAFMEDVKIDQMCAYVTSAVYKKLSKNENNIGNIELITNITLGCDPEAFLVDKFTKNIVAAHRFMKKHGSVGHDGLLLEFRPNPSVYAEIVCDNLWQLIKKARIMLDNFVESQRIDIISGSSYNGLTAGFHLHYGLPHSLLGKRPGMATVARLMTTVFDYYVGIPAILPEGDKDIARRTTKFIAYGKPGDYRIDNKTFEFRLPGGINLSHPILTKGLLALGATVAEDLASRINTCTERFLKMESFSNNTDLHSLYPHIPDIHIFYGIICNPCIGAARYYFEEIKKDVRHMVGYNTREKIIETYFECLDRNIDFGNNIEQNWGTFYNEKQQREMVVLQSSV